MTVSSNRPAPVALEGQQEDWRCPDCGAQADEWFDCCKNPARAEAQDEDTPCTDCGGTGVTHQTERRCSCQEAEAQDEGAAAEPLGRALYEAFWKRNGGNEPAWCDQASAIRNMWDAIADDAARLTHPSSSLAADEDRMRAALVWIAEQASGVEPPYAVGMLHLIEEKALAALKSEGK